MTGGVSFSRLLGRPATNYRNALGNQTNPD
jgi:hypothetical protein